MRCCSIGTLACGFLAASGIAFANAHHLNVSVPAVDRFGTLVPGTYDYHPRSTPSVDAFAQSGVRFDSAFNSPVRRPARFTTMTGRSGLRTGVQNFSGVLLDIMQRRNAAESLADRLTMGSLTAGAANVSADAAPAPDRAARRLAAAAASLPRPTHANVAYGPHQRQVLDFWQADTDHPAPLLFFIHGGGWNQGDKVLVSDVSRYLKEGISVVSINYRLVPQAAEAGVQPPIRWPLADAARALQFVRTMARKWNVDEDRIVASGNSAGACSSLWLAFRDDLADPDSPDPVARESTRLLGAAVINAQTSLDPWQMKEWTPNSRYGGHAFGFTGHAEGRTPFDRFIATRNDILHLIQEYSPYEWVSSDDPPVYLYYSRPPAFGEEQSDPTHTANFGVGLAVRLREAGVDFELVYPGVTGIRHATIPDFVIALLASESR